MSNPDDVQRLMLHLNREPAESEWLEFKRNNADPELIGRYVSGLANSAALLGKPYGYIVWGIDDRTRDLVGTDFIPQHAFVRKQPLELWLLQMSRDRASVEFGTCEIDAMSFVVARIACAIEAPVRFNDVGYIRIDQALNELSRRPKLEAILWRALQSVSFERQYAADGATDANVVALLDAPAFFRLHEKPLPTGRGEIIQCFESFDLIARSEAGGWSITNLAALLYATDIDRFAPLRRKAIRVIRYVGTSKVEAVGERSGKLGYAVGFENIVAFVKKQLPSQEVVKRALRKTESVYPAIAIRELLANTLIHQDFTVGGAGPLVEIYDDRIEFTNPGEPLVHIDRFLDSPPRSRNDHLAKHMRLIGVCEERGSGVDKVVTATEEHGLPSPRFQLVGDATVAALFAPKGLRDMDVDERVRACYMHASLRHVGHGYMTNATLRQRFMLQPSDTVVASRIIKESIEAGKVKVHDPTVGNRARKYSPYWA